MYTYEDLAKYDYFKGVDIEHALDSLTGVLARGYILGFAQKLIEDKVPFAMCIMDIDNFKLINDNYGHMAGDICLKILGDGFIKQVGNDGLVGRFGGDEFVILYLKATDYDSVHSFLASLYGNDKVVRRTHLLDNVITFVTGTCGCASYPQDANNYDDLFTKVDKALYRGKTKGRNCFIIYVESKHRHIEVHRKEEATLPNIFSRISEIANDSKLSTEKKIKNILNHITYALHISEAVYLKTDKTSITGGEGYKCNIDETCIDIFENLTKENTIFMPNGLYNFLENEKTANFIKNKKILTFIVSKVKIDNKLAGFLILFESEVTRIWQEKDVALLLHLNTVIELLYKREKKD